jgi:hypothetical protein
LVSGGNSLTVFLIARATQTHKNKAWFLSNYVRMAKRKKSKNPAAVALGRLGGKATKGLKGIVKGFAAMDAERRREIAMKAVEAKRRKRQKSPK